MADNLVTLEKLPTIRQRVALRILRRLGWRLYYASLPEPRGVAILYPHTSNWDVVIGLLARCVVAEPYRWLGKEALFKGVTGLILGSILRKLGCVPIERSSSTGAIARLAQQMREADWYWLALSPEGTRSYRNTWRSGFYHIALAANVPVLAVGLDYATKTIQADTIVKLTGDKEKDRAMLAEVYRNTVGLRPENACPIDW